MGNGCRMSSECLRGAAEERGLVRCGCGIPLILLMQAESRLRDARLRGIAATSLLKPDRAPPAVKPISCSRRTHSTPRAAAPMLVRSGDARGPGARPGKSRASRRRPDLAGRVGEFLYRTARFLMLQRCAHCARCTRTRRVHACAYPCGGAPLTSRSCTSPSSVFGLDRGFYYYDALDHQLVQVTKPTSELEQSCSSRPWLGGTRTQILVTIASRFQQHVLEDTGGLAFASSSRTRACCSHICTCAAGMGLASRALGASDSDLFSRPRRSQYRRGEARSRSFQLGSSLRGSGGYEDFRFLRASPSGRLAAETSARLPRASRSRCTSSGLAPVGALTWLRNEESSRRHLSSTLVTDADVRGVIATESAQPLDGTRRA